MKENEVTYLETPDLYIPAFVEDMLESIKVMLEKEGELWKYYPVEETEEFDSQKARFTRSINNMLANDEEFDWAKIAVAALVCWIRENDPQVD